MVLPSVVFITGFYQPQSEDIPRVIDQIKIFCERSHPHNFYYPIFVSMLSYC